MSALAVSLIDLIKLARPSAPKQSGINYVVIIGVVSGLVTIAGAVIGVARYSDRRKQQKIDRRVNELVTKQLDAEEIEKSAQAAEAHKERVQDELARLGEVKENLSQQISQVPEEVDRLLRIAQLEQLATSLSREFKEYISIERELQGRGTAGMLDARIREAIEHDMLPAQRRVERRNTYILALVVLLLALSLSPIRANYFIYNYFSILGNSPNWTSGAPGWMIIVGSTVIALLIFVASSLSSTVEKYIIALGGYRIIIGLSLALIITIALGYYWRDYAITNGCTPYPCGYPRFPYTATGIAFNVAPVLGGLLLISIISLNRNRSVKRKLLATTSQVRSSRGSDSVSN